LTALGTLIPGAGLIAAGRPSGKAILSMLGLGVLGAGVFFWQTSFAQLTSAASSETALLVISVGLFFVAFGWLAVALASQRALEPRGLSGGRRFAGSLVVIATASLVITPIAMGAQYVWAARSLIGNVSNDSPTATLVDAADPWADLPRVNVLLMGGDGGEGRDGVRPDTLILTSIDTETGEAIMFSLPRQLANVPFPEGTALAAEYPAGFQGGDPINGDNWLNAVYRLASEDVLEDAFPGSDDPHADATKQAVEGALGIKVDFYVLANLAGFSQIIDAMGGITIDVPYPIPIGTKIDNQQCIWTNSDQEWIEPGDGQQLSGSQALWFARARCTPWDARWPDLTSTTTGPINRGSDHNRMERQRCMMGAIAANADPASLLTNFQALASAAGDTISTDIPPDLWSAFAELGLQVKNASITSVTFNNKIFDGGEAGYTFEPNWDAVHAIVQDALSTSSVDLSDTVETSTESASGDDAAEAGTDGESAEASETEQAESEEAGTGGESSAEESGSETSEPEPTDPTDITTTC
jgi:LCP family protein required for cell wall assembly